MQVYPIFPICPSVVQLQRRGSPSDGELENKAVHDLRVRLIFILELGEVWAWSFSVRA